MSAFSTCPVSLVSGSAPSARRDGSPDASPCPWLTLAGERVQLLPERALWHPASRTLVVADVHWGKGATFRAAGIPVPRGTTADDLARLDTALDATGAERLLVLGDLVHSAAGWRDSALAPVRAWRARRSSLPLLLVRGNHDVRSGAPPADLDITDAGEGFALGGITCVHDADATGNATGSEHARFRLAGHVHPTVSLSGRGGSRVRLPAFVIGDARALLPAFSTFTGSGAWARLDGDAAFVIADGAVLPVAID
jgi:DNA ligase-associated metallophosphoesterase